MRILKIELQNINSLKSDHPIVIDFESEKFRDVGLYAITGSTGAGKTTILDAITIAMYHSVPRFNKSNIKAGLIDVVSFGADEAMARVTFQNKGVRYEVQWSIRLSSQGGKRLAKPQEKVRLKNLDSETILAEKKREVQTEIENITQLNYNQFLRSAMLAQGEFAAFLSADVKEKGTLLEQITGEEIYKKIGEAVNQRISEERSTLGKIKSRINTEDLLPEDVRRELLGEDASLAGKIENLDKELLSLVKINSWFSKTEELDQSTLALAGEDVRLVQEREESQIGLNALAENEKAEPFKHDLREVRRIKKEIEEKGASALVLEAELKEFGLQLENAQKQQESCKEALLEKENEQSQWQPKLDEVTQLDIQILHLEASNDKAQKELAELKSIIEKHQENNLGKQKAEKEFQSEIQEIELFLKENKNAPLIEKKLRAWGARLEVRKGNRKRISQSQIHLSKTEAEEKENLKNLRESQKNLESEREGMVIVQTQIDAASLQLESHPLAKLIPSQTQLGEEKAQLKELSGLSSTFEALGIKQSGFLSEKSKLEGERLSHKTTLKKLVSEIETAEEFLKDAEKILELKRNIKNYEEDRKKLKEGEACGLCGSTEHPYVAHYPQIQLSESQKRVEERQGNLDKLKVENQRNEIAQAKVNKALESTVKNSEDLKTEIADLQTQFSRYGLPYSIEQQEAISEELEKVELRLKEVSDNITLAQKLQKEKDQKEAQVRQEQKKINQLEKDIAGLEEKGKGYVKTIEGVKTELNALKGETEQSEASLRAEFAPFDLELPEPVGTNSFITNLEDMVADFDTKSRVLSDLGKSLSNIELEIKNEKKRLQERGLEQEKLRGDLQKTEVDIDAQKAKRNVILPLSSSPQEKREALLSIQKAAQAELEKADGSLNAMHTKKVSSKQAHTTLLAERTRKKKELAPLLTALQTSMAKSDFVTHEDIQKALLDQEQKELFTETKKSLEKKALALDTRKSELMKAREKQANERDFEMSLNEVQLKENSIKIEKGQLQERTGEIRQKFELDQQIKDRNKDVFAEIEAQEKVLTKWKDLMNLLGGSKDAFNTYVQRLTLQNLIQLANFHLYKLNPRFSLKMNETYKSGEELNFNLIDHYQTDQARPVDTSSGGEKFLISLALALGLSDLASNNVNIESLFIDEGFGTLDNNTLETVISTLETLRAQGKMIGIISHVENLKERIPTQIRVVKKSNGVSIVEAG